MKKQLRNFIFYSIAMMITVNASVYAGKKHSLIMSYEDYANTKQYSSYYYSLKVNNLSLFCLGVNDLYESENYQCFQLQEFWNKFLKQTGGEKCVVLIEGSRHSLYDNEHDAIMKSDTKGGLLKFLAHQQNITVLCLEPDEKYLKVKLSKDFLEDEIVYRDFAYVGQLFYRYKKNKKMQQTGNFFGNRKKGSLDLEFEKFYDSYNTGISFDRMKEIHRKIFEKDLDVADEQWFYDVNNPLLVQSRMNVLARRVGRIRDEFIIDYIAKLKSKKNNIFIACNVTNVVMQEQAINSLYGIDMDDDSWI